MNGSDASQVRKNGLYGRNTTRLDRAELMAVPHARRLHHISRSLSPRWSASWAESLSPLRLPLYASYPIPLKSSSFGPGTAVNSQFNCSISSFHLSTDPVPRIASAARH